MNAIAVRGLAARYGSLDVLAGIDLEVGAHEVVAVLGRSGCGKTTLLRCLAGLETPAGGTIGVAGEVGIVFQEPRLLPWLDVRGNVAFAARDAEERRRVDEVLALVGLTHAAARLPKQLSGGMAQRVALARALVRAPRVLLLDEPFAALDALTRISLRTALREILTLTGAAAVLVTHDVDDALALADRTVVLGGTPARIIESADVSGDGDRHRILHALGVDDARTPSARTRLA